ncbi:MAG TPA: hypothetical protein VGQ65_24530 [Thermoanaerobaculia bacterium]|jgi:uncharacterized protein (DUF433 family)|nr:hypothetical protein [Thermoanaerobaculia bacterium]
MAFDRITSDPAMLSGQPCIRGRSPDLDEEDVREALEYAASRLDDCQ